MNERRRSLQLGIGAACAALLARISVAVRHVGGVDNGDVAPPAASQHAPAAQDVASAGNGGVATAAANGSSPAVGKAAGPIVDDSLTTGNGVQVIGSGLYPVSNPGEPTPGDFADYWSHGGFSYFDQLTANPTSDREHLAVDRSDGGLTTDSGVRAVEGGLYPLGDTGETGYTEFHHFWAKSGFSALDHIGTPVTNIAISANGGTAIADASGGDGNLTLHS